MEFQKLLMEMQEQGCAFVLTAGHYEEYMIEAVFLGWFQAVEYFSKWDYRDTDEYAKKIEVWHHDRHIGTFREKVVKRGWDVNGSAILERGLEYEASGETFIMEGDE